MRNYWLTRVEYLPEMIVTFTFEAARETMPGDRAIWETDQPEVVGYILDKMIDYDFDNRGGLLAVEAKGAIFGDVIPNKPWVSELMKRWNDEIAN